ncbi:hypothetical protein PQX77_006523 [Marasmius sp. AFHP31]|nr:hypothetical protein PQX77_006523 [Marasmius sp. AFHP31]
MTITLDNLSAELLAEIFNLIHDSSRHTIFSLLLVNKFISGAALPFVYQELTFDFGQERGAPNLRNGHQSQQTETDQVQVAPHTRTHETLDSLLQLIPESSIWTRIRKVTAHSSCTPYSSGSASSSERIRPRWDSLIEFLSRIVNLQEFIFDCTERVPIPLLQAIETYHPTCRLHVRNWVRQRSDTPVEDPYGEALARSPCLKGIQSHFMTEVGPRLNWCHIAFERILALSPSVEEVSYTSRTTGAYAHNPTARREEKAEEETESEQFRVTNPVKKSCVRRIKWMAISPALLRRWGDFIDLQKVENLDVARVYNGQWMEYAVDHRTFVGLKHLSFKIDYDSFYRDGSKEELQATLEKFISSLSPLESLSIIEYHGYIDLIFILVEHGSSLRSLSLHQPEHRRGGPRPVLTHDDLTIISTKAPHLKHLEFDLNRTRIPQANEMQTYTILSTFRFLRKITIHYDTGMRYETSFQASGQIPPLDSRPADFVEIYSKVDDDFVREVWQAVLNRRLEVMELYIGEPRQQVPSGYSRSWPAKEEDIRWVRACRSERDDLRNNAPTVGIVKGRQKWYSYYT